MLAVAPPPPTERQHLIAQARSALLCWGPQPAPPGGGQTWSIGRESAPRRRPLLPDLQPRSPAMGLKDGNHLTAAARLQPTVSRSEWHIRCTPRYDDGARRQPDYADCADWLPSHSPMPE